MHLLLAKLGSELREYWSRLTVVAIMPLIHFGRKIFIYFKPC